MVSLSNHEGGARRLRPMVRQAHNEAEDGALAADVAYRGNRCIARGDVPTGLRTGPRHRRPRL